MSCDRLSFRVRSSFCTGHIGADWVPSHHASTTASLLWITLSHHLWIPGSSSGFEWLQCHVIFQLFFRIQEIQSHGQQSYETVQKITHNTGSFLSFFLSFASWWNLAIKIHSVSHLPFKQTYIKVTFFVPILELFLSFFSFPVHKPGYATLFSFYSSIEVLINYL